MAKQIQIESVKPLPYLSANSNSKKLFSAKSTKSIGFAPTAEVDVYGTTSGKSGASPRSGAFEAATADDFPEPVQVSMKNDYRKSEMIIDSEYVCFQRRYIKAFSLFMVVLLWMALGMGVLCSRDNTEFVTALYILAQMITTIGYGDVPMHGDSDGIKFFLSLYALSSIIGVSWIITAACEALIGASQAHMESRLSMLATVKPAEEIVGSPQEIVEIRRRHTELKRAEAAGNRGKSTVLKPQFSQHQLLSLGAIQARQKMRRTCFINGSYVIIVLLIGMVFFGTVERCTCSYGATAVENCEPDNCEETGGYVKSYMDAWYMSCISLTTIGFGDYSPKSEGGRAFAVFWMVSGIVVVSHFTLQTSKFFLKRSMCEKVLQKNLDKIFDCIDRDHSGELSRHEFFLFALMEFGLINEEEIEQLNRTFDDLDTDKSGKLSREEVKARFEGMREIERMEREEYQAAATAANTVKQVQTYARSFSGNQSE